MNPFKRDALAKKIAIAILKAPAKRGFFFFRASI